MKYWIIPSNNNKFRLSEYLEKYDCVDWRQSQYKYEIGDIVYLYCSKPESRIRYMMQVEMVNLTYDESVKNDTYWSSQKDLSEISECKFVRLRLIAKTDSELLSVAYMQKYGLRKAPQGAQSIPIPLLEYINGVFESVDYESESIVNENNNPIYEGAKKTVEVNQYERNLLARKRCIQQKGCKCVVCGMDFERVYGPIGNGFIHVHHIVPISSIGENYQVDYEKDLVPVCPNCHAMLHKKVDGKILSVEELKSIVHIN